MSQQCCEPVDSKAVHQMILLVVAMITCLIMGYFLGTVTTVSNMVYDCSKEKVHVTKHPLLTEKTIHCTVEK